MSHRNIKQNWVVPVSTITTRVYRPRREEKEKSLEDSMTRSMTRTGKISVFNISVLPDGSFPCSVF